MKNYLGKTKQIKAPLNWKSSPNSPPTQLAYITQPEIDLLVKANLHGSMNGQPNVGPKGIMSLDGGGVEYKDKKGKPKSFSSAVQASEEQQKQFAEKVAAHQAQTGGSHQSAWEQEKASDKEKERLKKIREGKIKPEHTFGGGDGEGDKGSGTGKNTNEQSFNNSQEMAEWVVNWWKKRSEDEDYKGYRKYGDRTNFFTGNNWNTSDKIIKKLTDKFNKGYYSLTTGPNGEPLIVHSTGTMVNPFTGSIISTQTQGDQGGAYQNRFAKSIGVDTKYAGVFSKEYQKGKGLAVSNMKPQHALRHLINKNPKALEQFYQMNKNKKGFNPFSVSSASAVMSLLMNAVGGPVALQVGNNLERAGWGKAIKDKDGKYTVKLTEDGAKGWQQSLDYNSSPTFKGHDGKEKTFYNFISPEAIEKDKNKGWLSDLLGTKKFKDVPIDLTNLIEQGGYQEGPGQTMGFAGSGLIPQRDQVDIEQGFPTSPNLVPIEPKVDYGFMPQFTPDYSKIPGSVSDDWREGGSLTNYPQFTPEGYKISAYNPSINYGNQGGGGQNVGGGQGGGGTTPNPNNPTNAYGNLTFDVYGRPVTYDYTGGPEQLYLGGGWKKDGQYIGSPWGFKSGGIANFKPYGY